LPTIFILIIKTPVDILMFSTEPCFYMGSNIESVLTQNNDVEINITLGLKLEIVVRS